MLKECKVCGQLKDMGKGNKALTCPDCLTAGYKYCATCGEVKPVIDFGVRGLYLQAMCRSCQADYRQRNKDRKTAQQRLYRATEHGYTVTMRGLRKYANTAQARQIYANARHRRRGAEGTVTAEEWQGVLIEFNHECAYCGSSEKLTQDHIVAISVGGTNTVDNLVPACQHCNFSKNALDMHDWYSKQHFFNIDRYNKILHHMEVK